MSKLQGQLTFGDDLVEDGPELRRRDLHVLEHNRKQEMDLTRMFVTCDDVTRHVCPRDSFSRGEEDVRLRPACRRGL